MRQGQGWNENQSEHLKIIEQTEGSPNMLFKIREEKAKVAWLDCLAWVGSENWI